MAGLGGTYFDDAMKIFYLPPLNDQIEHATVLLDRLDRNKKDVSGLYAYVPITALGNPGVGSRTEPTASVGALLPGAGRQTYDKATFKMIMHYGQGSVSGGVMRKSRNKEGAFAEALATEMAGLGESLPDMLNRQLTGMGNGRAATISSSPATKTTCDCYADGNFRVKVGDRIVAMDITDSDDIDSAGVVSSIDFWKTAGDADSTTKHKVTVSVQFACTTAEDTLYFGEDTSTESLSAAQEMLGIQALIDDGDIGVASEGETVATESSEIAFGTIANGIGGIDRDETQWWQSQVDANGGVKRAITRTLLIEMILKLQHQNGAKPSMLEGYTHPSVWGTIGMLQVGNRIYNDYQETVKEGWVYIEVQGTKIFADRDMPDAKLYFMNMEDIFLLTQGGYEFMDDDGRTVRLAGDGTRDAWSFVIQRDLQLGHRRARRHGVIKDLEVSMNVDGSLH